MARKTLDPQQKKRRRRRRLGTSLVLLLVVLLVPPYFVGNEVEKGIRQMEARLADHPTLSVKVNQLDRGWFSTNSIIDVSVVRRDRDGATSPLIATTLHSKTNHGLFYLSPLFRKQQARLPGAVLSELSDNTDIEVAMSSSFRPKVLFSSIEDTGTVRALGGEHEIHTKNMMVNVETSTAGNHILTEANIQSLKVGNKEAPLVEAEDLTAQGDIVKPHLVEGGFIPATVDLQVAFAKLSINAMSGDKIKDFSLDIKAVKGDLFSRDVTLTIGFLKTSTIFQTEKLVDGLGLTDLLGDTEPYCNPGCDNIEISVRISGLDAQAAYMVDTQLRNIKADMDDFGSSTQLAQIFAAEPTIEIRRIKLSAFEGELDITGKLKLKKVDSPAVAKEQLTAALSGEIKMHFDAALIKGYRLKQAGFFSNKDRIRSEAGQLFTNEVASGEYQHDKSKDRYSAHYTF